MTLSKVGSVVFGIVLLCSPGCDGRTALDQPDIPPCPRSSCRPRVVVAAPEPAFFQGIATDSTNVYFADNNGNYNDTGKIDATGRILSMPIAGGDPKVLAENAHHPEAIAVDATSVYWVATFAAGPERIMKVAIDDGKAVEIVASKGIVWALAVDASNIYWIDYAAGTVMKVAKAGGTPVELASGKDRPQGVAIDEAWVYWTTVNGSVLKVPIAGGDAVTLATGPAGGFSITVDATNAYWIAGFGDKGAGVLMKVPLEGGAPVTLASSVGGNGVAVDASYVYWCPFGDGKIGKVPIGGGEPVIIACGRNPSEGFLSNGLALSVDHVYWTSASIIASSATEVVRVPKQGCHP